MVVSNLASRTQILTKLEYSKQRTQKEIWSYQKSREGSGMLNELQSLLALLILICGTEKCFPLCVKTCVICYCSWGWWIGKEKEMLVNKWKERSGEENHRYPIKGKGICFKSRHPWLHMFFRLPFPCRPDKVGTNAACNYWSNLESVHQVPIKAGWTDTAWNAKFAWHMYTWPVVGIKYQTFWSDPMSYPLSHMLTWFIMNDSYPNNEIWNICPWCVYYD